MESTIGADVPPRGSFGAFDPSYEIAPEVVTIRRKWWLALGVPLLPFGLWFAAQSLATTSGLFDYPIVGADKTLDILAGVFFSLVGFFALRGSIWPPHRIRVTSAGISWGFQSYASTEIETLGLECSYYEQKTRTRTILHSTWMLTFSTRAGKVQRVRVVQTLDGLESPAAKQVVASMRRLLGRA
jgi:hypothetical protein